MAKLKILVCEYITGGGFNTTALPDHLAQEGLLMLQGLLDNLNDLTDIHYQVLLDSRIVDKLTVSPAYYTLIGPEHEFQQVFLDQLETCDAAWPIAPETEGILLRLCEIIQASGKILLTSPATAVALAGNKWLTYQQLLAHAIATVATFKQDEFAFVPGEWLIKPLDGVGCEDSHIITNSRVFVEITSSLEREKHLIQPHLQGEKTSLSCLFKQGEGWLICANRQHFEVINQHYHLVGITVNFTAKVGRYLPLVDAIAKAFPDLWGYVGIDLIETAEETLVLEINPRLTTSFVGIAQACGVNCAELVLSLLAEKPKICQRLGSKPYLLTLSPPKNY